MGTWAEELRYCIEHIGTVGAVGAVSNERMLSVVELAESQIEYAHAVLESLVEANAALRAQLHELRRPDLVAVTAAAAEVQPPDGFIEVDKYGEIKK